MAYIGKTPTVGNFQVCDAISVVNGQAAYTLQVGGVNVAPESANHMLVSLNGILQKPGSSFTISGSTMTFASNLATGDVIDFVQILGNVLDIGTPSDATVTTAKLANSAVDLTSKVTGALPVANGGTGVTTASALANTGNLVLLNTQTTTDGNTTNIDFDSTYINSTYDNYYVIANIKSATDSTSCRLRFSNGGTFQTGASYYGIGKLDEGNTLNDNDLDYILLTATNIGNASTEGASFVLNLNALPSTTSPSTAMWNSSSRNNSGYHGLNVGSGLANNVDEHDGIRFYMSSGNFASGSTISLYGVKS